MKHNFGRHMCTDRQSAWYHQVLENKFENKIIIIVEVNFFQYINFQSYVSFGQGGRVVPAVWFRYNLNPITVKYHETRPLIYHFLTTVCAIVGGTFTVAGINNSLTIAHIVVKKWYIG